MKQTKIYLLIFLFISVLSLSACSKNNNPEEQNVINDNQEQNQLNEEDSTFSGTVTELFAKKKSLRCVALIEDEEQLIEMTYYFDNKGEKFRVNTRSVNNRNNEEVNSSAILKDGWYYFWDDFSNIDGMKTKAEKDDEDYEDYNDEYMDDEEYDLDMEEEFDFDCQAWKVDNSIFELPNDKSFKDLSELNSLNFLDSMDSDSNYLNSEEFDLCSLCEMMPEGPEKEDCLSDC